VGISDAIVAQLKQVAGLDVYEASLVQAGEDVTRVGEQVPAAPVGRPGLRYQRQSI
jgi:hypothetical protein